MTRFTTLTLAGLALTMACAVKAKADDDLFSEVAVESVFAKAEAIQPSRSTAASSVVESQRITGAGQLGSLLRELDFEPKRLDSKGVKVTVSHGPWTIPTTLRAAVSRSQIDITMGLATPEKSSKLAATKLLSLLKADTGAAYFAFDEQAGQVQLRQSVSARGLTSGRLSRLLKEMAELAASRESSWYTEAAAESSTPTTPLPAGTWLAKPATNEAFALQISANGAFSLAYVRGGGTVTSKGTVTRAASQITLAGVDGTSLSGTISGESPRGFRLSLTSGRTLQFSATE